MTTPQTVKEYRQAQKDKQFGEYCYMTTKLLAINPQGLTLPVIQTTVGVSAKTAKNILALVAFERDGKYFVRNQPLGG